MKMPDTAGQTAAQPHGAVGIFGGTFDPVHFGHLRLAEEAADRLGLDGVRWIPAGQPSHRATENKLPPVAAAHRLEMVRLAVAGNPRFELDAAEADTVQPSYTVPTLERLRSASEFGAGRPLVLLLGADAFGGLTSWHRWGEILSLAHIAVAHRPGFPLDAASLSPALAELFRQRYCDSPDELARSPAGRIAGFAMTPLAISATGIRAQLAENLSPRYLLPDAVIAYIRQHALYPVQKHPT